MCASNIYLHTHLTSIQSKNAFQRSSISCVVIVIITARQRVMEFCSTCMRSRRLSHQPMRQGIFGMQVICNVWTLICGDTIACLMAPGDGSLTPGVIVEQVHCSRCILHSTVQNSMLQRENNVHNNASEFGSRKQYEKQRSNRHSRYRPLGHSILQRRNLPILEMSLLQFRN